MPVDHEAIMAMFREYVREESTPCGLCAGTVRQADAAVVWIAHRKDHEGYVRVARPELWCPGCERLACGLDAKRHLSLPKGTG